MLKKAGNETSQICRCLLLPPSTFYYRIKYRVFKLINARLGIAMKSIYNEMDSIYGKRSMLVALVKKGFKLGLDKVRRLMKKLGLVAKKPKQHSYPRGGKSSLLASNHLNRQFNPATINRYWRGSDITYIKTEEGWLYLCVIIDLYGRMVIGRQTSHYIDRHLVCNTLEQVLFRRHFSKNVLIHSDRGCQYCSADFKALLLQYGLRQKYKSNGELLG